ncbi:uncharacterized protein VNE69_02009 [Vairimorpha necatrix]|uniref:Uncharacterized protein n=1 Tax=Vairimorpha necatrix TaxID=6039 RepID=A0AAX4J9C3_9MICR
MKGDSENSPGIKNTTKFTRKIYDSPSSKARILTPVKNALHKSDGNPLKFLKAVQNIVGKENIQEEGFNIKKTEEEWEI